MRRYWKIYKVFFTSSIQRELEFKANFIAKLLRSATWMMFSLVVLLVIFRNTDSVAGWKRGDTFILLGSTLFLNAFVRGLFFSLMEIPQHVRMGTLDFVLTKPVDSQFWISIRRFAFDEFGAAIAGTVMILWGLNSSHLSPTFLQFLGFAFMIACSVVTFYSILLMMMATAIWFVKVDNLWVLSEVSLSLAQYPQEIFGSPVRAFFTYVLPIAFLAAFPAQQLVRGFDATLVGGALIWAICALAAARLFWNFALTKYGSASS